MARLLASSHRGSCAAANADQAGERKVGPQSPSLVDSDRRRIIGNAGAILPTVLIVGKVDKVVRRRAARTNCLPQRMLT